jgi:methanogenic corrinoid protein MtbC1
VRANKVGRQVFYSLADPEVANAISSMGNESKNETVRFSLGEETTKAFTKAAISGDESQCTAIVDSLMRQGVAVVRIYHQLFSPSLAMIGSWWEVDAIDDGQEHLASAIIERLMSHVVHYSGASPTTGLSAVLGCSQGNWHSIGLRMVSDILRTSGWKTYYLGANVSNESFLAAVREHQPDVALVSVPYPSTTEDAFELVGKLSALKEKSQKPFSIGAGGLAVNQDPDGFLRSGADFTAANLMVFSEEILPRLEGINTRPKGLFPNSKKID